MSRTNRSLMRAVGAFKPAIHQELWAKYGNNLPPSDQVARAYLVLDRGFSDSAADEVLREFRSTLKLVKMPSGGTTGTLSETPQDEEPNEEQSELMPAATIERPAEQQPPDKQTHSSTGSGGIPKRPDPTTIHVPYAPGEMALVQASFPMSESAWEQMLKVLDAMKPGLVRSDPAS